LLRTACARCIHIGAELIVFYDIPRALTRDMCPIEFGTNITFAPKRDKICEYWRYIRVVKAKASVLLLKDGATAPTARQRGTENIARQIGLPDARRSKFADGKLRQGREELVYSGLSLRDQAYVYFLAWNFRYLDTAMPRRLWPVSCLKAQHTTRKGMVCPNGRTFSSS
jgi:hypothetical protein